MCERENDAQWRESPKEESADTACKAPCVSNQRFTSAVYPKHARETAIFPG